MPFLTSIKNDCFFSSELYHWKQIFFKILCGGKNASYTDMAQNYSLLRLHLMENGLHRLAKRPDKVKVICYSVTLSKIGLKRLFIFGMLRKMVSQLRWRSLSSIS